MVGNSRRIPHFITARSPKGLRRLMLSVNIRDACEYEWIGIQFAQNRWIAWYYKDVQLFEQIDSEEKI